MADIDDVTSQFAAMASSACFPNGENAASVTGGKSDIFVAQGWPKQAELPRQIAAGVTNISVISIAGGKSDCFQTLDKAYVIRPAVHGMSASTVLSGLTAIVTIAGAPGQGEFLTIVAAGEAYSRGGATVAEILAALNADIAGSSISGSSITVPTNRVTVHVGASATMGIVTHRQRAMINITVWAPSPQARSNISAAIDVALKASNRIVMPDTTQATYSFSHLHQTDVDETKSIYRRDLVFAVEYATLETFEAYEVTSVGVTIDNTLGVTFEKTTG